MREISALVDRLVPGLLGRGPRSVVCIWTTRPKYLVFEGDGTRPVCIVEFGPTERLNRIVWGQVMGWNKPYPQTKQALFAPLSLDIEDEDREERKK